MSWREALRSRPMERVAVVARAARLRDALVRVADLGAVEFDRPLPVSDLPLTEPRRRLQRMTGSGRTEVALALTEPDLDALEREGRTDLLAGEAEMVELAAQATVRDQIAGLVGWTPAQTLPALASRLAEVGAAAAPLPWPKGVDPPTAGAPSRTRRAFAPLVDAYATVPYADVDPSILAGLSYAVMFGAMFGDVGHGAILVGAALFIRSGRPRRLAQLRPHWMFIGLAGAAATVFGFAYGECFGPTGLVPRGLISPMEQPVTLLVAGVVLGVLLLAGAYAVAIVDRIREGGLAVALYAPGGIAGAMLFAGIGLGVAAAYWSSLWLGLAAGAVALTGLALSGVGLFVSSGGGAAGAVQAGIETFDLVVRLGANILSFARLAAFGLTHAVIGWIVWTATSALWGRGPAGAGAAVIVFVIGNAVAFALEALVAAVQALRLEYYELFSRVFQVEGRPFRPWHIVVEPAIQVKERT
jgi:V/A-type H+/Na+-transporting ATPase subunit I